MSSSLLARGLALVTLLVVPASTALARIVVPAQITGLVYLPDGKGILSTSQDGYLRKHDPDGKQRREVLAHKGGVFGLALSKDGKWLATAGADHLVRLWDTAKFKEIRVFRGHGDKVVGVAISLDGKWIASGGYDKEVRIWDLTTGKVRHQLTEHDYRVTSVAFSPDGKTLVSGGITRVSFPGVSGPTSGDRLCLWDVEAGTLRQRLSLGGDRVVFSPSGHTLAATGLYMERATKPRGLIVGGVPIASGSRVGLLDWRSRSERLIINEYGSTAAFSLDGKLLATGWGARLHYGGLILGGSKCRGIHLWETASGQEVLCVPVTGTEATVLAISPDGRRIASGTSGGSFKVHSLAPAGWSAEKKPTRAALEKSWENLEGTDSVLAYRALWDLSAGGDQAVSVVTRRLEPIPAIPPDRLRKLLADLDSDTFATREQAQKELAKYGDSIENDLERVLQGKPTLEVRKRVQALLAPLRRARPAEDLLASRAVLVLERIATPAARKALEKLSKGASGARLTRDAQETLKRLSSRK